MVQLYKGDCVDLLKKIPSGTVDLILTDMPYGTVKGAKFYEYAGGCQWDEKLNMEIIWQEINRITRPLANVLLFSQEPFSTQLINSSIRNIPFGYRCIWKKDNFANPLIAKKACVNYYEDILYFSRNKDDYSGTHPLRDYFRKTLDFIGLNLKQINQKLGHRKAEHVFYVTPKQAIVKELGHKADHCFRNGSGQFEICTEKTYAELIEKFDIDKMDFFIPFSDIKKIHKNFNKERVFNLPIGEKFKSNVFEFKKDYDGFHPTQKPVLLLEDLIKTFSNENNLVVDFTMGSGSTGVACVNTFRNFIGIEQDENYFNIATNRIEEAQELNELL